MARRTSGVNGGCGAYTTTLFGHERRAGVVAGRDANVGAGAEAGAPVVRVMPVVNVATLLLSKRRRSLHFRDGWLCVAKLLAGDVHTLQSHSVTENNTRIGVRVDWQRSGEVEEAC